MPMALGLGLGLPYMAGPSGPSPALDLNFVAMAASQALDSRITYTGASLATLVNAAGLIAYKPHNLLTWSAVSTTNWSLEANVTVTAGSVADPDGAMTGATIAWGSASAGNGVLKVVSGVNGAANSKAIYVRADVAGGTVELVDPGSTVGSTVATLTTSWQRVSLSEVAGAQAASGGVWLRKTASSPATIYVCWATFNFGPLQPYYPTTGSAYFGPRFTYDPVTHAALGLLIEEQRTNLLTYSEKFDNAIWLKQTLTVTANQYTAPDGSTTADALVPTSGDSALTYDIAPASAVAHTFSIWLRSTTGSSFSLDIRLFRDSPFASISTQSVTLTTAWQRFTFTGTPLDTSTHRWRIGNGSSWATGEDAAAWGAQLEAGSFATSYIPTTSASVTRAADSATMTGANFSSWFNAAAGTFVWEGLFATQSTASDPFLAHNGTISESIGAYISGGTAIQWCRAGGVTQAANTAGSPVSVGSLIKIGAAFSANDFRASSNGSAIASDAAGSMPSGVDRLGLAGSGGVLVGGNSTNAPISRLRYYNTALTNAQLQALTA